jgi:hypothetical protein
MLLRARCRSNYKIGLYKIKVWCLSCPGIRFVSQQNDIWYLQQKERTLAASLAKRVRWGEDY